MQTDRLELQATAEITEPKELIKLQVAALEAAANPIVISSRDGIILWTNRAFEHLSGYTREETLGQSTRLLKANQQSPYSTKTVGHDSLGATVAGRIGQSTQGWPFLSGGDDNHSGEKRDWRHHPLHRD